MPILADIGRYPISPLLSNIDLDPDPVILPCNTYSVRKLGWSLSSCTSEPDASIETFLNVTQCYVLVLGVYYCVLLTMLNMLLTYTIEN